MKLESLAVRNFRGIGPGDALRFPADDVPLTPIDLTSDRILIVGANNSGKSSLLHAYDYFVTTKQKAVVEDFFAKDTSHQILIEAKIRATTDELEDDQTKRWFQNNVATIRKVWNDTSSEGQKYTYDPENLAWESGGFGGLDTILQNRCPEPIWVSAYAAPDEIISQLQALIKEAVIEHLLEKPEYAGAEAALNQLRELIEGDQYISEMSDKISASVKEFFPDASLKIHNPASDKGLFPLFDKQAGVQVSAQQSPELPLERHGHGLQRQLVLSALQGAAAELSHLKQAKATRRRTNPDHVRPRILLIEEPELFLSPPSVRVMKRLITKLSRLDGFQIMAATHSPTMVDLSSERQTIVRVTKDHAASSYSQIDSNFFDKDDRRTLRAVLMFNNYNSDCIFYDHVIIAEGAAELVAIQTLADRMLKEKECSVLLNTHVMQFGGKNEIPLIQRILRHLKIPYLVIHDLDDPRDALSIKTNKEIGEEVLLARGTGLSAFRFAFEDDFETAHGLETPKKKKDKPINAFNFVSELNLDAENMPILLIHHKLANSQLADLDMSNDALDAICTERNSVT